MMCVKRIALYGETNIWYADLPILICIGTSNRKNANYGKNNLPLTPSCHT